VDTYVVGRGFHFEVRVRNFAQFGIVLENEDSGVIRGQYGFTPKGYSGIDDRDYFPTKVDKPVYHFGRSTHAMKLERSSDFQNGRDRNGHFGFTKVES
jgi:hypothetical protein